MLGALALVALLAGGVAVATVGFDESVAAAKETVSSFASFAADAGPGGYALFALAYGGMEVLLLPATPLALAAGALWPVLPATALCSCGALVGATTAFVLGRTVARSRVVKLMEGAPQLRRLDSLFSKDDARSAKFVLLLNLSPLASLQNLLNYAYGTTGVRLVPYMAASWVACLPRTWATVAAGSLAGQQLSGGGEGPDAGLLVGFAVAVCATIVVAREAKLALDAEAD